MRNCERKKRHSTRPLIQDMNSHEPLSIELMRLNRLLGFLSGSVLAAGGMYFYVLQEYRISNELLTEDIYVCFTPFISQAHWTKLMMLMMIVAPPSHRPENRELCPCIGG